MINSIIMKKIIVAVAMLYSTIGLAQQQEYKLDRNTLIKMNEQYTPQPKVVTAADMSNLIAAPSDATILFDGKDLSAWKGAKGEPKWEIRDGVLCIKPHTGGIRTKESFGDCQIHIEWMIPEGTTGKSQQRGNSGIYIQERYEVQILDSYKSESYVKGQAASIYKQHAPLVNACSPQGKWNVYDIIFTAPTFKADGTLKTYAYITVLHNGVLVQNNSLVIGETEYDKLPTYNSHGDAPIFLQDHSNEVRFRNIWVRKL